MLTLLPGGGADNGGLGGISVGVASGVPPGPVGDGCGVPVPLVRAVGEADREGVPDGLRVAVAWPGLEGVLVCGAG